MTMSVVFGSVEGSGRADGRRWESSVAGSIVNVITIIVRRFGAMSLKP
jgi:hypothetical protein